MTHTGEIIAERDGLKVISCTVCGFAHLYPLPNSEQLDAYYSRLFWGEKGKGWIKKYEAEIDWVEMRSGDWLSTIEKYTQGRSLLDIGCGWGHFVGTAAARGWDAVGLDPSLEASEYARAAGRNVATLGWEQYWPARRYDAITAFWLLEHLPAPLEFLRFCRSNLADGGVLCLAVPNDFSLAQYMVQDKVARRLHWLHSSHVAYFTPASLGNLLGRAGFRVVEMLGTYPMENFVSDGRDYTVDEAVGDACHAEVRRQELALTRESRLEWMRRNGRMGAVRDLLVFATPED